MRTLALCIVVVFVLGAAPADARTVPTYIAVQNGCADGYRSVWVMSGWGLLASRGMDVNSFLNATYADIRAALDFYVTVYPDVLGCAKLLVLNIEHPVHPNTFGTLPLDLLRRVIAAFKLRIDVAADYFPNAALGLFGIVNPHGQGLYTPEIIARYKALRLAGLSGMYDRVTYLCPSIYFRFGPNERGYLTRAAQTYSAIDLTRRLVDSNRLRKRVLPFLSATVYNGNSAYDRTMLDATAVTEQRALATIFKLVKSVVVWVPSVAHLNDHAALYDTITAN